MHEAGNVQRTDQIDDVEIDLWTCLTPSREDKGRVRRWDPYPPTYVTRPALAWPGLVLGVGGARFAPGFADMSWVWNDQQQRNDEAKNKTARAWLLEFQNETHLQGY